MEKLGSSRKILSRITGEDEIIRLKSQIKEKDRNIKQLKERMFNDGDFIAEIKDSLRALKPYQRFEYVIKKPKKKVDAVMVLSDLHIGEMVFKNETEGYNEYNYKIAERRLFEIADSFLDYIYLNRNGYCIDKLVVIGLSDYISGWIHDELIRTNEFPVPEQCVKSAYLISETLRKLASHFDKVEFVDFITDNHGRMFQKTAYKGRARNNFSFMIHHMIASYLANIPNIKISKRECIKDIVDVGNYKFLCTHGNDIKSWQNVPLYGILRAQGREAVKRMVHPEKIFHYQILGHFHVGAFFEDIILNGSLSGTSELDEGCGRHSPPAQITFLVGKHGVFNFMKWTVR